MAKQEPVCRFFDDQPGIDQFFEQGYQLSFGQSGDRREHRKFDALSHHCSQFQEIPGRNRECLDPAMNGIANRAGYVQQIEPLALPFIVDPVDFSRCSEGGDNFLNEKRIAIRKVMKCMYERRSWSAFETKYCLNHLADLD